MMLLEINNSPVPFRDEPGDICCVQGPMTMDGFHFSLALLVFSWFVGRRVVVVVMAVVYGMDWTRLDGRVEELFQEERREDCLLFKERKGERGNGGE